MTIVDLSGEIRDLAGAVEELEDTLETTKAELARCNGRVHDLEVELEHAQDQIVWAQADEEVYELLSDLKRGVIDINELLERTVGR